MNILGFIVTVIITLLICTTGFSQLFGLLFYGADTPKQAQVISYLVWCAIIIGYHLIIYSNFGNYYVTVLVVTTISAVMVITTIKKD